MELLLLLLKSQLTLVPSLHFPNYCPLAGTGMEIRKDDASSLKVRVLKLRTYRSDHTLIFILINYF